MYNLYGYVEDSKKEQGAERGRSSGCFRRLPCGQNIDQCRASDKGEGSERQFAPRIARPGKRRQRGEIKGIARDPAPDRRRSVWRMEYTSASRKLPRPKGPDDGRPAGRAHQAGAFARREKPCRAQRQAEPAKTLVHGGRVNALDRTNDGQGKR